MLTDRNMEDHSIQDRIKGFLSVYPQGQDMLIPFLYSPGDALTMRKDVRQIIKNFIIPRKIDALLAANDISALILLGELNASGLNVPEDIALIGHDNEFFSECCPIPLTTIDENNAVRASCAVNMLLDIIREFPKTRITHKITVKPELVIRRTA